MKSKIHFSPRRLAALSLALLPLLGVAACGEGSTNAEYSCVSSAKNCLLKFRRDADHSSVRTIGTEAELVDVQGDTVTLRVEGRLITLRTGESGNVAGYRVKVYSVTARTVEVQLKG